MPCCFVKNTRLLNHSACEFSVSSNDSAEKHFFFPEEIRLLKHEGLLPKVFDSSRLALVSYLHPNPSYHSSPRSTTIRIPCFTCW